MNPCTRILLFVEGKSDKHYFDLFKKRNNVVIVPKLIDMKGGGYKNFLREIKKSRGQFGYLAAFVMVDLDRLIDIPQEKSEFCNLLNYCKNKCKYGSYPHFLLASNRNFEYFVCLHSQLFKNGDTSQFIIKQYHYKNLQEYKEDKNLYDVIARNGGNFKIAIDRLKQQKTFIHNIFKIKHHNMDIGIIITKTEVNPDALAHLHSNIYELIDIIAQD